MKEAQLTFDNIVETFFKRLPEFSEYFGDVDKYNYGTQFSVLPVLMRDLIDTNTDNKNDELLKRICSFLNDMAESKDETVQALLDTDIFIGIYDDGTKYVDYIKKHLSESSLRIWDETIKKWVEGNNLKS